MGRARNFVTERLRFRHLLLVRALAATRSLRKAAQALGISQSAATKALRELERGLDARLFTRSALGVAPTDQGTAFIRAASAMLAESEAAREELHAMEQGAYGKVRVGLFAIAASPIVSEAVVALQASSPRLSIRIEEGTGSAVLHALQRGDLDCAIGRAGSEMNLELPRYQMRGEPVALIVRRGHPLARKKRLQLRDVVKAHWIIPTREALHRQPLELALAAHGLELPSHAVESSAFLLNEILVAHTDAVCPLPFSLAKLLQGHEKLCVLPVSLLIPMPPVVLWTRQQPPYPPALQKFIGAVTAASAHYQGSVLPVSALRPARLHA